MSKDPKKDSRQLGIKAVWRRSADLFSRLPAEPSPKFQRTARCASDAHTPSLLDSVLDKLLQPISVWRGIVAHVYPPFVTPPHLNTRWVSDRGSLLARSGSPPPFGAVLVPLSALPSADAALAGGVVMAARRRCPSSTR